MPDNLGTIDRRAHGYPRIANNGSWSGGCAAFVYNVSPMRRPFARALLAAAAAGAKLIAGYPGATRGSLNPGRVVGMLAYFGGVPDGGTYDGHVAIIYPNNMILGGSHVMAAYGTDYGHDVGMIDLDYYAHLTGLPYLGCGPWDGQTIPTGGLAGLGSTPLNNGGTPAAAPRTENDMYCIGLDYGKPTQVSFSIGVGILQRHSQGRQQELAAAQAQQPGGCYWYDDDDFARTMWNHGLGEFTVAQARALQDNGHLVARAVFGAYSTPSAPLALTDAQLATIGAAVKVGAVDTSALEKAIASVSSELAALDTQADTYQAALVATLAKGLTVTGTATPAK